MSKQKGDRRERRARKLFEQAGYAVENPNHARFSNKDFYNLFDFMAVRPDKPVTFVQVKSGAASGIESFIDACVGTFPPQHTSIYYVVYHKREGWRLVEVNLQTESYQTVFDGRKTNENMGDGLTAYLQ